MVTRGFKARQSGSELSDRIPPGQHLVDNFPVLIDPADWNFTRRQISTRPAGAKVVPMQGDMSAKQTGATQMLSRTIYVDGLGLLP